MSHQSVADLTRSRLLGLLESPCETARLDFKESVDLAEPRDRVELAKDVLAMANSGGGDIVVGVEDQTRRSVGIGPKPSESLKDAATVNDKLSKYCGGYVKVLVAQHELASPIPVRLALIQVPPALSKIPAQADGAYPDPGNPSKQVWLFRRGDVYVRKGDQSVKVETPQDLLQTPKPLELGTDRAGAVIASYKERLGRILTCNLPLLPPSAGAGRMSGERLVEVLAAGRDLLLQGGSGLGKSVHLRHACLAMLKQDDVPLLLLGSRYKGEGIASFIGSALAPFCQDDTETVLAAASVLGLRLVLTFDGLNECRPYLDGLAAEIQAFRLKWPSRLLLASQVETLPGINCECISMAPLDTAQKRFIYCHYAGIAPTADVDHFCQGFSNAYDLKVAGACHIDSKEGFTRLDLYDRYCRESLPPAGASVLTALLRDVAGRMGQEFTSFWPRDNFERHGEEFLLGQAAPLSLLDQLRYSRLVDVTDEGFSFEHDLLFDYFRAEKIRREQATPDAVATELAKPKNQSLVGFLLPRYRDTETVQRLLRASLRPEALREVLLGRCGEAAQQTLIADCEVVCAAVVSDLASLALELVDTPGAGKSSLSILSIRGSRVWTDYEIAICDAIAISLDNGAMRKSFLELLRVTQWAIRGKVEESAGDDRTLRKRLWAEVLGQLHFFRADQVPFFHMAATLREETMVRHPRRAFPIADELFANVARDSADQFSLAILLEDLPRSRIEERHFDRLLYLARLAWGSGIGHLRLMAVTFLHDVAGEVEKRHPERLDEIKDFLSPLGSKNIFLNTAVIDAQLAYGLIEPFISVDDALGEMKATISAADGRVREGADVRDRAYGLISNLFEDIYQGAYCEAYESLSKEERIALLCLAAEAKDAGFSACWILGQLVRDGGASALPIFQRYASFIDGSSSMPQEAAGAFAFGIIGCAQMMDEPPPYTGPTTADHTAWATIGTILFWVLRNRRNSCTPGPSVDALWARLLADAPFASADALYRLRHGFLGVLREEFPDVDLIAQYPREARPVLEYSLRNYKALTSVFGWGGSRDDAVIRFVIEALGQVGDDGTVRLLKALSGDGQFGLDAIAAIKKIRTGGTHKAGMPTRSKSPGLKP